MLRMTAPHAQWPLEGDPIFAISGRAKAAQKELGKENVMDATIGAIMDDEGNLLCFDSVYDVLKSLPNEKIAAYAPIAGTPDFLTAVEKACFAQYRPSAYIKSIATPGGSGGLKIGVHNYTSEGDDILVGDWFWGPYKTITEEGKRGLRTFELFTQEGKFNIPEFEKAYTKLVEDQKRALTIINTPAHNPTGYSVSDQEWDQILDIFKKLAAKDPENKLILVVDTAYIDFAGTGTDQRKFFKKFENLPENIFVMVAFSMSKGYTMYGQRIGAIIGISSNEGVVEDFFYSASHAGRANWSNGNRGAMETLAVIDQSPEKLALYEKEKEACKILLQKRGAAFVKAAKEADLEILPYIDGFFVTMPYKNPKALVEKLTEYNIYTVALGRGVRFAICAVDEATCAKAPAIIKKAAEELA